MKDWHLIERELVRIGALTSTKVKSLRKKKKKNYGILEPSFQQGIEVRKKHKDRNTVLWWTFSNWKIGFGSDKVGPNLLGKVHNSHSFGHGYCVRKLLPERKLC